MMYYLRREMTVLVAALTLVGCAREAAMPRPRPGDVVSIELICLKKWEAAQQVILGVKLRVQNPKELEPVWLAHDEVPHDVTPRATLAFWRGDELLKTFDDVPFTQDC